MCSELLCQSWRHKPRVSSHAAPSVHLSIQGAEAEAEAASWAAAAPALATIRAEVSARRFIAYSGPPHAAADITTFAAGYFSGLWNLVALGALTGRIAVLPLVQCSSPWISRQAESRLGIDQARVPSLSLGCGVQSAPVDTDFFYVRCRATGAQPGGRTRGL